MCQATYFIQCSWNVLYTDNGNNFEKSSTVIHYIVHIVKSEIKICFIRGINLRESVLVYPIIGGTATGTRSSEQRHAFGDYCSCSRRQTRIKYEAWTLLKQPLWLWPEVRLLLMKDPRLVTRSDSGSTLLQFSQETLYLQILILLLLAWILSLCIFTWNLYKYASIV